MSSFAKISSREILYLHKCYLPTCTCFSKKMGFASWTINGGRTRKMRGEVQRLGEIQEERKVL